MDREDIEKSMYANRNAIPNINYTHIVQVYTRRGIYIYMDIYNSQLRYGFRYLVYLVSPLLLERLTSISILLYQFEGQAYVFIHRRVPLRGTLSYNQIDTYYYL
jgi:hypothetical protein